MTEIGLREDQVKQVRGFADQQLRKPEDPENPGNRRVSVIVKYMKPPPRPPGEKKATEKAAPEKKSEH